MDETRTGSGKKLPRMRRLTTLSSIRKEICRCYEEARNAGADPIKVQYFRALTFILSSAASVRKDEGLEDIEKRLTELEKERGKRDE